MEHCPCGSGKPYYACCKLVHQALAAAQTPEQLMRARYAAFSLGLIDFLYDSFHPDTRRFQRKVDIQRWAHENKWMQLEVREASAQTVTFKAHFLDAQLQPTVHHEKSTFKKFQGKWYYYDGRLLD
ncbi:YchJ family metal-binding protein [Sphingobacterium oryzagri]|uniref:YchJ family metal-binding protein n=1 Tax=Sphingobacterium oryzagri TaxID=3025669 RepID=A0ABY7WQ74_9SPHI|nr:YchJ family metal-binding protein [Sphingobacterium sp. KACC 22765]WDF70588.1 YchJ family metal-binding protein [Sphingobacterium sp. KACC 22765]